jgi:lysophospholipase L1-like esterase
MIRQRVMRAHGVAFGVLPAMLFSTWLAVARAADEPVGLRLLGDWQLQVTCRAQPAPTVARLTIARPPLVTVQAERYATLPEFQPKMAGWRKGAPLQGVKAQECTSTGLLDPASLELRGGPAPDATRYERGMDYDVEPLWGTVGRLPGGRIGAKQPVWISYRHGLLRIDSIVLAADGRIVLRQGTPHAAAPRPPELQPGERRLANAWLPGPIAKLTTEHLFPVLETAYPEPPQPVPSVADRLLPKTMKTLREGGTLRVLAWGDSVTVGTFVPQPERNRWQAQFVARLGQRFPRARIELITEAWGGRNTSTYLAQPPGAEHNYRERVLDRRPDLIVSEFVNDAGLSPAQVEERYSKLLNDFRRVGAEWIILTPHYVRPDWMKFTREQQIDADPRPYVTGLRAFAARHDVALADAALRWGRLWRQGIPYRTLLLNAINHPDPRGMQIFADSLMWLFPQ